MIYLGTSLIKMVIDMDNPELVITEGHPTDMIEEHRNFILAHAREKVELARLTDGQKATTPQPGNAGYLPEAGYAAYLANQKGIPFVGGEVSGKELFKRMGEHGYSARDVTAAQFMREIAMMRHEGKLNMTEEEFIANYASGLLRKQNLTLEQFSDWYKDHPLTEGRSFFDVNNGDFEPHISGEYLQKMSNISGMVRDEHLASLIFDSLDKYNKAVIAYGTGHLISLNPLLKRMFGNPGEFTQLVPDDKKPNQSIPDTLETAEIVEPPSLHDSQSLPVRN